MKEQIRNSTTASLIDKRLSLYGGQDDHDKKSGLNESIEEDAEREVTEDEVCDDDSEEDIEYTRSNALKVEHQVDSNRFMNEDEI